MFKLIKKIFGTAQGRILKKYSKLVKEINILEEEYQKLQMEDIVKKTAEFKQRYQNGETLDELLVEAYAVVKNICRRLCGTEIHVSGYNQNWDMVPYDVQLLGAIAMHFGSIAEMQTGEGKTLTAALPLYLNALSSKAVHLVTVNDYLAKRDCEWIGTIFTTLGLSVKSLTNDIAVSDRKAVYASDIVYGTASEFGFDYLRDNSIATNKDEQCQRKPYFAIIDEIDSILIDEARTPLIISGPVPVSRQMYDELKNNVALIVKKQRDLCNHLATDARKTLQILGYLEENPKQFSKEEEEKATTAFKSLWLVSKGTPRHKVLNHIKENPDLRAKIEKWDTFYHAEQNKEEKGKFLSELYIIVDERSSEYELTDKGIRTWGEIEDADAINDFIMLDLGYEYSQIDNDVSLSDKEKLEKKIKLQDEDGKRKERSHNLRQLFRAHLLMEKDVDYIVQENQIIIIDENTGRPQPGRRFSDGLHQAIEAKEEVAIQHETQTYATITLQNFFRMYEKLSGMSGTAITEANEFKEIYKLEVLAIPTHTPCIRTDHNDEIYMTEREKYNALLKEIIALNTLGRPILIGTESVEISEKLSRILRQNKLPHTILNAKNHAKEAEIIAEAGKKGAITLATNMAGRGTDIKLLPDIKEIGGLHVIGTTRHQSRRIDRQLRGRSGRLGDPGSSKFFVSFEDSLMRLFASPKLTAMLQRFRPPECEPISANILNRSIETAQKRIEQRNYTIRKHTLEYDDVMNKQRQEIYSFRNELLHSLNPLELAKDVVENICTIASLEYFIDKTSGKWDPEGYRQFLMAHFPVTFEAAIFDDDYIDLLEIQKRAINKVMTSFEAKIQNQIQNLVLVHPEDPDPNKAKAVVNEVIRNIMVRKIDHLWQEHLLNIDHLRTEVSLRVVGQKDPLIEFKQDAFLLFASFSKNLQMQIGQDLFKFEMVRAQDQRLKQALQKLQLTTQRSFLPQMPEETLQAPTKEEPKPIVNQNKVARNEDCPCGSGKKYKKCCGTAKI
ncbi:MAG: preprotein translocase subunit SecA [Chlamydiae bacterium]|nr:preprotein translocase subunit SecA [Chlamydiota bacterium]